ncbi:hypothetical protein [Xenorhabdus innexi]|uniref:Uncharacterized protein n=1 Tax=Xenorhabdus innexi TaxID=290109 RepID=A0A1N6MWP8_9GAMM|nr:hypothetical protein [Xenorhabdus innexi]PHM35950.1 hypothetical protein Xinn_02020 [Xenorhabdus innexi]SIP73250.1 hypothetical protein XIS1_1790056 [Xenorhabdus innexi]
MKNDTRSVTFDVNDFETSDSFIVNVIFPNHGYCTVTYDNNDVITARQILVDHPTFRSIAILCDVIWPEDMAGRPKQEELVVTKWSLDFEFINEPTVDVLFISLPD